MATRYHVCLKKSFGLTLPFVALQSLRIKATDGSFSPVSMRERVDLEAPASLPRASRLSPRLARYLRSACSMILRVA